MSYHMMSFFLGFLLDLLFGDPHWLPHPIRLIGWLISSLEKYLFKREKSKAQNAKKEFCLGICMILLVLASTFIGFFLKYPFLKHMAA